MENSKNTDCWYAGSCENDCLTCLVYPQMKWQFDNSGLPKAKYKPIRLSPQPSDRRAFNKLAEIRENIDEFVALTANLLSDEPLFFLLNSYTTGFSAATSANILNSDKSYYTIFNISLSIGKTEKTQGEQNPTVNNL